MRDKKRFQRNAVSALLAALLTFGTGAASAEDFDTMLARVDAVLEKNPGRATDHAIESCFRQRKFAIRLYKSNQHARAERSLKYCYQVLKLAPEPEAAKQAPESSIEEVQAQAARELEQALTLTPNLENGLEVYRECAACHKPEGWGLQSGLVPQLAGQHRTVVIKQLADIRSGSRETIIMAPYATVEAIGGTQAVADVAGYIDTLEISTEVGHGPGDDLAKGEQLYRKNCAHCHGATGAGDADAFVPRIHAQHFNYLVRQFERIRSGERHNANADMRAEIESFDEAQTHAVLDFVSRLEPPAELQAPPGWKNPDFAE